MRRVLIPVLLAVILPLLYFGACRRMVPSPSPSPSVPAALGPDEAPKRGPIEPPPQRFRIDTNSGGVVVRIDFDCAPNADGHESFHRIDGGPWLRLSEECVEDGPVRGHIFDNQVQSGKQACYRVTARNRDGTVTSPPFCITVGPS